MFCRRRRTRPTPNSTADNTRKKKVKERILMLSKTRPTARTITYRVIHKSSAVSNKCSAVLVFINTLKINIKKKRKSKFKSPISIEF
jgi:hypothetical protein